MGNLVFLSKKKSYSQYYYLPLQGKKHKIIIHKTRRQKQNNYDKS